MSPFTFTERPQYIFFLQHPEQKDHYLIIQDDEITMNRRLDEFNRRGIYEKGPATMPYNKVSLIEKVFVPDENLFGLHYFICHETKEITYEEDMRYPYAEWGWFVVKGHLQINKWLHEYLFKKSAQRKNLELQESKENKGKQIRLF